MCLLNLSIGRFLVNNRKLNICSMELILEENVRD